MAAPRTAKQVIDQAIRENRHSEWLCYGFAVVFIAVGVAVIVRAMCVDQSAWTTVLGSAVSLLFMPALNKAHQIRKENLAIRLLEAPLSKAATEEAAADMLQRTFIEVFIREKG